MARTTDLWVSLITSLWFLLCLSLSASMSKVIAAEVVSAAIEHEIVISGFAFQPAEIRVAIGDHISWLNQDVVPHNIALPGSQAALSPTLQQGQRFSMTVTAEMAYICGLHPSMKGAIMVDDAANRPNKVAE